MITVEMLRGMHTRKLVAVLRSACIDDKQLAEWSTEGGQTPTRAEYEASVTVSASAFGFDDSVGSAVTLSQLKAELAGRPHVPNKQEAKRTRQERARKGHR